MAKSPTKPKISINKLGEYLTANPGRRRKIVFDCKYPAPFIVSRYQDAESAIVDYFTAAVPDIDIVIEAIDEIASKKAHLKPYQIEHAVSCEEALDKFIDCIDNDIINIRVGVNYKNGLVKVKSMIPINGVDISVRPEILIYKDDVVIGAIKLYFSKSAPLNNDSGEYIASMLKHFLENHYTIKPKIKDCIVLDVFQNNTFHAPSTFKRRLNNIEAACEEIAARWTSI